MKKAFLIFFPIAMLFNAATAQKNTCMISGKISGQQINTPLQLSNLTGTKLPIPVKEDSSFTATLEIPAKGFYALTDIGRIYLEPGYNLQIAKGIDGYYHYEGKGSMENNTVADVEKALGKFIPVTPGYDISQEVAFMSPQEYIGKMQAYEKYATRELTKSSSPFFREIAIQNLKSFIRVQVFAYQRAYGADFEKNSAAFKFYCEANKNDTAEMTKAYQLFDAMTVKKMDSTQTKLIYSATFENWDKNNAVLFQQSDYYRQMLHIYLDITRYNKYGTPSDYTREPLLALQTIQEEVKNPFILEYLVWKNTAYALMGIHDKALKDSLFNSYIANAKEPKYIANIKEIYTLGNTYTDNAPAPDFCYEDITGKNVSLKDLRGQYVYIDIWATWCGACISEMPSLVKIEERYQHKNIHFVSLSVDKMSDKQKWMDFVKEKKLGGIQLLADKNFTSEFITKFNIRSIPRFLLIAPDGIIVNANAPAPSQPELITLLDEVLSEKEK